MNRQPVRLTELPITISETRPLSEEANRLIAESESRLQAYWDQWHQRPIEQYVACDFGYVAQSLRFVVESKLLEGNTFCEWGCGFGVVTGLASLLGMEAIGIEAEPFLVEAGRKLLKHQKIEATLWEGNFLPRGAEKLADHQSHHASMFHQIPPAYDEQDLQVDDFALIFAYPWPGEEHFLREVFARYARPNALLLMFRGPYQIELYCRASSKQSRYS